MNLSETYAEQGNVANRPRTASSESDAAGQADAPSLMRLAPKSNSLAHCGKIPTGNRCYQSALRESTKGREVCHEMFESQLQS
jgi:hypothetical protein